MKTKCYSVRLSSLERISDKAYKAVCFDGSSDFIPVSQVLGEDFGVEKSDAYWISAWILKRKSLQYSTKKSAWFDENGNIIPNYTISEHVPEEIVPDKSGNDIAELKR